MASTAHRLVIVSLVVIFGVAFFVSSVHAQSALSLQISPAVVEDRANPGDTYNFSLKVTNTGDSEQTFYLLVEDIKGLDDSGQPIFAEEGEATVYDISTWIQLPQDSITLKAGEQKSVPYVVKVPANASPGSHFGAVFFDARPPGQRTTGSAVNVQIGSVVSLRIAGDISEDAVLREFSTDKLIYDTPNVAFTSKVENLGNVLLRPHGLITITNMFGREVAKINVNDTGSPVFPQSDRSYLTNWTGEGFTFGRYQAVVALVYGEDSRKTISATNSFWVLPTKPLLITLGTFAGIILLLYLFTRLYIKRKLREMGISGKLAETGYYARRYGRSSSKLLVVFSALFLFCMGCLVVLFVMFS